MSAPTILEPNDLEQARLARETLKVAAARAEAERAAHTDDDYRAGQLDDLVGYLHEAADRATAAVRVLEGMLQ